MPAPPEPWAGKKRLSLRPRGRCPARQRARITTSGVGVWRSPREGAGLRAPACPHPLRGLSHRTGGRYQGFLPVLDVLLYSLNPLQEFLEEKFRGRGSKQARLWPLPHSMVGGVEARGWKMVAGLLSQLFKVLSQSLHCQWTKGANLEAPPALRMEADFASSGQTLSGLSVLFKEKAPQKNQREFLLLQLLLIISANLWNLRI